MNCYWCDAELIWGGDHDIEDGNFILNILCELI
ncbi:MAG: hypothetical protein CM15mV113_050 [Caudoviricetes sp.]|nr:MAG: hypothetical protein CM15mV113_050 [Caudoviricetes sp.]